MTLSLIVVPVFSQTNQRSEPISVNVSIVGKGTPNRCNDGGDYYFTVFKISNVQDTAVHFWIMSCSWPVNNFLVRPRDSLSLRYCGCDSNIPEEVTLAPQKSVEFYEAIRLRTADAAEKKFQLGFKYFKNLKDILNWWNTKDKTPKFDLYWSNDVEIRDNLYDYRIDYIASMLLLT